MNPILFAVGIASAITVGAAYAPTAAGSVPQPAGAHVSTIGRDTPASRGACYSQLDNDNGKAIISQRFDEQFIAYNSRAADDFTLERPCVVRSVDVAGTYFDSGPAIDVQTMFYRDDAGSPGHPIAVRTVREQRLRDTAGSFHIPFVHPLRLRAGDYWISVRVSMTFAIGGQWGWNTNDTVRGRPAVWKNYRDGFATGCTTYQLMTMCFPGDEGGDFAFAVNHDR